MLRFKDDAEFNNRRSLKPKPPLEHDEQAAYFTWWWQFAAAHKINPKLCFAIPNASALSDAGRIYKWKEGLTKGVTDVALLIPTANYHGLLMEFKRKGERPSADQEDFMRAAESQHFAAVLVFSAAEAVNVVELHVARALYVSVARPRA